LKDAEKISGKKYDLSSYADIVEAIHVIQTEMGITGTTQLEAEKTISGSVARLKAAWANLITGMGEGDEDKLDWLVDDVVEAAKIAARNILPVAEKALYGILHLIEAFVPTLARELPGIVTRLLPAVVRAAGTFIIGIAKALPQIGATLIKELPTLWAMISTSIRDDLIPAIAKAISGFIGGDNKVTGKIMRNLTRDFNRIVAIVYKAVKKIREFWDKVLVPIARDVVALIVGKIMPVLFNLYDKYIVPMIERASSLLSKAFDGISKIWKDTVYPALVKIIDFIRDNFPLISSIVAGVVAGIAALAIGQKISGIVSAVKTVITVAKTLFGVLMAHPFAIIIAAIVGLVTYLVHLYKTNEEARDKINAAFDAIKGFWENTLKPAFEAMYKYVVETLIPTMIDWWENHLQPAIESVFSAIAGFWENILKPALVALYDYVYRDLIPTLIVWWEYKLLPVIEAVFTGISKFWDDVAKPALEDFKDFVSEKVVPVIQALGEKFKYVWDTYLTPVFEWVRDSFIVVWKGLGDQLQNLLDFIQGTFSGDWEKVWNGLVGLITTPFNTLKDVLKAPINAVIKLVNSMISKVESAINTVVDGINNHLRIDVDFGNLPDWLGGGSLGGIHWGANLSRVAWGRIQELANGGALRPGQKAIVGEYAPELLQMIGNQAVVTPLSKTPGRFPGGQTFTVPQTTDRPINIVFELDGAQKWIYRLNKAEEQRVGLKLAGSVM